VAKFSYTAEKSTGEVYKGVADAKDRFELYQIIRREGGHLLSLEDETAFGRYFTLKYWSARIGTVTEQEKILFTRNLGVMLSAGLPLSRALSVMERQASNPKLVATIAEIASEVRHGTTLFKTLEKYSNVFPKLMVAMVRAGEEGGDLASALQVASEQMERSSELRKKIKSALLYPCIILLAIVGIGALMMIYVVPTLSETFREMGAKLPVSTQIIMAMSDFFVNYTVLAFGGMGATILGFFLGIRTPRGKRMLDKVTIKLPLIGVMAREVNAARTSRTMSALLTAGVDVMTSLDIAYDVVQNTYFKEVILEARKGVEQGDPLSMIFIKRSDLYPPLVGEMMAVGEETGQTPEMMRRMAIYYEAEVDRKTKDMSSIIEPFLMLFIGVVVGFFAISIITPIYGVSQHIQ
jgi:type IV pilus assembly protein PilC